MTIEQVFAHQNVQIPHRELLNEMIDFPEDITGIPYEVQVELACKSLDTEHLSPECVAAVLQYLAKRDIWHFIITRIC